MKILGHDQQENSLRLEPQCLEDLWYLHKILEKGDLVEGVSFRRFKSDGEEGESGEKKKVHITVKAEQVEFAENASKLRVTGIITAGTPEEFVAKGSHHTLDIEIHERVKLFKILSPHHWAILQEAKKRSQHVKATLVVMDEHEATLAELQLQGLRFTAEMHFRGTKKDPKAFEEATKAYFSEIAKALEAKEKIIIAGPGFAKDNFKKYLEERHPALAKKATFEYTSSAEKSGVFELLKRGVIEKAMGEQRLATQFGLIERLKASIGREDHLSVYGFKDVENATNAGAVKELLVFESFIKEPRVQKLMEKARLTGVEMYVFDTDSQPGQEIRAFGLAALLRYAIWA